MHRGDCGGLRASFAISMLARHRRVVQEGVVALDEVAVLAGWEALAVLDSGWIVGTAELDRVPDADTVEPETGI